MSHLNRFFRYTVGMKRFLAILLACAAMTPWSVHAEVDPFSDPVIERPAPDMFAAIDRAKALLRAGIATREAAREKPLTSTAKTVPVDVTIAVWNKVTDELILVDALKDKKKLTLKTPFAYPITISRDNGVNSRYELPTESNLQVIGVAHPTFKDISVSKKKPLFELHDKVYVPYHPNLYTPESLRRGSDYLSYLLKDAYDELRAKQVMSRSFPGELLVDVIDPYLVKSIAIIEHTDGQIYDQEEPEKSVGRFLVTLALNGEEAFDFSVSSAGARGLVQFMPKTYAAIVKKYSSLHLIEDFIPAMADHTNAVKAQMALIDENLVLMPKEVRALMKVDKSKVAPFIAAAYNGGPTRVRKAFSAFGDTWFEYRMPEMDKLQTKANQMDARMKQLKKLIAQKGVTAKQKAQYQAELRKLEAERPTVRTTYHSIKNNSLFRETAMYVSKLNKVYGMLAAGYFATPNAADGTLGKEVAISR